MRKRIIFILLSLLMLGTIAFFYVQNILIPIKVKQFIEEKAQDYLKRKIEIADIQFKPFQGFRFINIKIYEKDAPETLFFFADEVRFQILFAAFFQHKTLIVPSLQLVKPTLHLTRDETGAWNIADLLNLKQAKDERMEYTFFVRKFILEKATADYADHSKDTKFFESYENIDLDAAISFDRSIHYEIAVDLPIRKARLKSTGTIAAATKKISAQLALDNFPLSDYVSLLTNDQNLTMKDTFVTTPDLTMNYQNNSLDIKASLKFPSFFLKYADGQISGPFDITNANFKHENNVLYLSGTFSSAQAVFKKSNLFLSSPLSLTLKALSLKNKEIKMLADLTLNNAQFSWSENKSVRGQLMIQDIRLDKAQSSSLTWQKAVLESAELIYEDRLTFKGNLLMDKLSLTHQSDDLSIDVPFRITKADCAVGEDKIIHSDVLARKFQGRIKGRKLYIDTLVDLPNMEILFGQFQRFLGSPNIELHTILDLGQITPPLYKGSVTLSDVLLEGMKPVGDITRLTGKVSFDNDVFSSEQLSFRALDSDFHASGQWFNSQNPTADIQLSTDKIDLSQLAKVYPPLKEDYQLIPSGPAAIAASYQGPLSPFSAGYLMLESQLTGAHLVWQKGNKKFSDVSGRLTLGNDQLIWKNLTFAVDGQTYKMEGSLSRLKTPIIETTIQNEQLDAKTILAYMDQSFRVDSLKGRYLSSSFNLSGEFGFNRNVRLEGDGVLNLEDLAASPGPLSQHIKTLHPLGSLMWKGSFLGNAGDWKTSAVNVSAQTKAMRLFHYPIDNVNINFKQKNQSVHALLMTASVYEGPLNIEANIDLSKDGAPFQSTTSLADMNLTAYRKDKKTKNVHLSGKLTCEFNLKGELLDQPSYQGIGYFAITEAYLGQLVPQLNEAIYTEANADFVIKNRKIITENAMIISKTVDLLAQGWVDFDKNIDLDITPALKQIQRIDTGSIKIDPATFLTQAVSLKMTGTLDNPIKKINTSASKVFKNTTGVIKEGIGSILEEIF
ncbi:MAG TPA: AsmA family protein [Candidatus Omnitrophota bacterium]|nr:AsmA family protein [Candidatus Omnitrophota bacterium]